jgi:hypothetical protein
MRFHSFLQFLYNGCAALTSPKQISSFYTLDIASSKVQNNISPKPQDVQTPEALSLKHKESS